MKRNKLGMILGLGTSFLFGCNLDRKDFEQTRMSNSLYENNVASIWAADYNGIDIVKLYDREKVLFTDELDWCYIKNPTGVLVRINKGRLSDNGVFIDESIMNELYLS